MLVVLLAAAAAGFEGQMDTRKDEPQRATPAAAASSSCAPAVRDACGALWVPLVLRRAELHQDGQTLCTCVRGACVVRDACAVACVARAVPCGAVPCGVVRCRAAPHLGSRPQQFLHRPLQLGHLGGVLGLRGQRVRQAP